MILEQATTLAIADAVVAELNAADLDEAFTAERLYVPRYELKDLGVLRVSVLASSFTSELASRSQTQDEHRIDVAVQKRFETEDVIDIDPLVAFTQRLGVWFRFVKLPGFPGATWVRGEIDPLYVPQHIESYRQFTSVVRLTYRMVA